MLTLEKSEFYNSRKESTLLLFDEEEEEEATTYSTQSKPTSDILGIMLTEYQHANISSESLNASILHILKDIKEFVIEKINLILNSMNNRRHNINVNGGIAFIELLPIMISTCQSLSSQLRLSSGFQEQTDVEVINFILEKQWKAEYFISLLNVFLDVKIEEDSNFHVCIIRKIQAIPKNVELSGMVQVLLKLSELYNSQNFSNLEYIQVIKTVYSKCDSNRDAKLNLYFIIQSAFQYSLPLLNILLKSVEQYYVTKPNSISKCTFAEHFCDFMMLLLAYKNELVKEKVFSHINQYLLSLLKYVDPKEQIISEIQPFFSPKSKTATGGSSSDSHDDTEILELSDISYVESIIKAACSVEIVSEELLSIFGEWCRMNNKSLVALGKSGTILLFSACESSRSTILQKVIGNIAEECQGPFQKDTNIVILESLLEEERAFAFCTIIERFYDYLSTFDQYPYQISSRILLALLPVTEISDYVRGELLSKLEKMCSEVKRENLIERRKLAIFGLSMLLSIPSYQDDQMSILVSLQYAFKFNEFDLKSHLYKCLTSALSKMLNGECKCCLTDEATNILFQILKSKVLHIFQLTSYGYEINFMNCFEILNEDAKVPSYRLLECVHELFKCFSTFDKLFRKASLGSIGLFQKIYEGLMQNFRDAPKLCSLLNLDNNDTNISVFNRISVVLPLIQALIEEIFQEKQEMKSEILELLEISSLIQKIEKESKKKKDSLFIFETCTLLSVDLAEKIRGEHVEWNKSWLMSLINLIDHTTLHTESLKEKLNDNFLKMITVKNIEEVQVLGKVSQKSLTLIRTIRSLFRLFITLYNQEQSKRSKIRLAKSAFLQSIEDCIGRDSVYLKNISQETSIVERLRIKILNLMQVYFEGVKLSPSDSFGKMKSLEKFIKYVFNAKQVQETISSNISTLEYGDHPLEIDISGANRRRQVVNSFTAIPLDFITLTFYFTKLLFLDAYKTSRSCIAFLKLIKTLSSVHPLTISIGIISNNKRAISADEIDDEEDSETDEETPHDTSSCSARLDIVCVLFEMLANEDLASSVTTPIINQMLMFLLNVSTVAKSLDYCADSIQSCILAALPNSSSSTNSPPLLDISNLMKSKDSPTKALVVALSYIELIVLKINQQFKKQTRFTTSDISKGFGASFPLSANLLNDDNCPLVLFSKIRDCVITSVDLIFTESDSIQLNSELVISKLEKIMMGLCTYVVNSSATFKKKIRKSLEKDNIERLEIVSENYSCIYDTLSKVSSLRTSTNAKNNTELYLTKNFTKLEQLIEKMCFDIRDLAKIYKKKMKKTKGFPTLEVLDELADFKLNTESSTSTENKKKRKNVRPSSNQSKKRKKSQNSSLRSKNKFIDYALCVEDDANYNDAFADLEDWIDDTNWSPSNHPKSKYADMDEEDE